MRSHSFGRVGAAGGVACCVVDVFFLEGRNMAREMAMHVHWSETISVDEQHSKAGRRLV